jgi:PAS domain S-box-containing protein
VPEALKSQEHILQRADGTLRYVQIDEFSVQVEHGFILGNVTLDITERKRAEEALRESESKFRNFVRQSSEGILVVNERTNVIEWNRGMEQLTGLERQDVLGKPIRNFLPQLLPDMYKETAMYERIESSIVQALQTGEIPWSVQRLEGPYQHDGSEMIVQQSLFPIETDKGFWIGGIFTDITER